jgi:hypothetical protein
MARPLKSKTSYVRQSGKSIEIIDEDSKKVITYIESYPKQSVNEIAMGTDVRAGTINAILECVPEAQELVRDYKVAVYEGGGSTPDWHNLMADPKEATEVPKNKAVTLWTTTALRDLVNPAIAGDFKFVLEIVGDLAKGKSPKRQKAVLTDVKQRLLNRGLSEEGFCSKVGELTDQLKDVMDDYKDDRKTWKDECCDYV